MATRAEKETIVEEMRSRLQRAQSAVLADYRGLNVAQMTRLRRKLRDSGVELKVVKNTLLLRAARELGLEGIDEILQGPIAVAFGYDDPVIPAKLVAEFAREHKQLEVRGGLLQGKLIGTEKVRSLADLPSREVLVGKVAGAFCAPLSGLVNVLNGPLRGLVTVLDAVRKKAEPGPEAA